jgi:hypothetical protein
MVFLLYTAEFEDVMPLHIVDAEETVRGVKSWKELCLRAFQGVRDPLSCNDLTLTTRDTSPCPSPKLVIYRTIMADGSLCDSSEYHRPPRLRASTTLIASR